MPDVLPCIKCGAPAGWERPDALDDDLWIMCSECDFSMAVEWFFSVEDAAKEWNRRPYIERLLARIAELEATQW
jgi:hypothetical protein